VNQIEVHPLLYRSQRPLLEYCRAHGIVVQAYASLGSGKLLAHPAVTAAATALGCTPAAALLRWAAARGLAVIPRSANAGRIMENMHFFAPPATSGGAAAHAALDALDALSDPAAGEEEHRFCWDPRMVR
jgi:diketogulonate reductase-like aldo/keto reductase